MCKIGFQEDRSLCEWRYECNACVWLCFVVIGVCESAQWWRGEELVRDPVYLVSNHGEFPYVCICWFVEDFERNEEYDWK